MGTWDSGPFENDMAMDFVSEVVDSLMQPVNNFLEEPMVVVHRPAPLAVVVVGVIGRRRPPPTARHAIVADDDAFGGAAHFWYCAFHSA